MQCDGMQRQRHTEKLYPAAQAGMAPCRQNRLPNIAMLWYGQRFSKADACC